jgi:uncharacterized protein YqeY
MSLKQTIESALKDAMRANDDVRKRTLRLSLAAIRMAELDRGELDDASTMAIVQKEIKLRQEAIEEARLAFLPKPLAEPELEELARQAIAEAGASSPREMGQVMKILVPRLQGRATGDQASQMVRKLLIP